jgi:hypothetical protein
MHIKQLLTAALLALPLAGCFQAQLKGGVAGAQVTMSPLGAPSVVLFEGNTRSEQTMIRWRGAAEWQAFNGIQKALWMGVFYLPPGTMDSSQLYLLTASGGRETDANQDVQYDDQPSPVRGSWHAILPGNHKGGFRRKISILTEACYLWAMADGGGTLTGRPADELQLRLDYAARRLVADGNGDGKVDYADVLNWNVSFDRQRFIGDPELLAALTTIIVLDLPEPLKTATAVELVEGRPGPPGGLGAGLGSGLLGYLADKFSSQ